MMLATEKQEALHMLQFQFDTGRFAYLERAQNLPYDHSDQGYVVHALFDALFGRDKAPLSFAIIGVYGKEMQVLAYSRHDYESLRQTAQQLADPRYYNAVNWEASSGKTMPSSWPVGTKLGFKVRVCPLQQYRDGGTDKIDAFLCAVRKKDRADVRRLDRSEVYEQWLRSKIDQTTAVDLGNVCVTNFCLNRFVRKTQAPDAALRIANQPLLPDVHCAGQFTVRDSSRFTALLSSGIGRNKGFGFGMVLLSPPAT